MRGARARGGEGRQGRDVVGTSRRPCCGGARGSGLPHVRHVGHYKHPDGSGTVATRGSSSSTSVGRRRNDRRPRKRCRAASTTDIPGLDLDTGDLLALARCMTNSPFAGMCAGGRLGINKPTQARISGLFAGASPSSKDGRASDLSRDTFRRWKRSLAGSVDQEWRRS